MSAEHHGDHHESHGGGAANALGGGAIGKTAVKAGKVATMVGGSILGLLAGMFGGKH